jgi:uncharacterized protein YceK
MKQAILALAVAGLAGCATTMDDAAPDETGGGPEPQAMLCKADAAQRHVGQKASADVGAAILADSGARTLRWGPPNGAWTMDYRQDRVGVRYDEAMTIVDIACG